MINPISKRFLAASTLAVLLAGASVASGTVMLLDFGPTTPTGGNLTNSPYHTVNSGTETIWNVLGTSDSSSLTWGDNSTATGVAVNLGRSLTSTVINFADQPGASNSLGTRINTGVFDGNSVGKDGVFHGSGGQQNAIGMKLTGLTVGITYEVFVVGINTNITLPGDSDLTPMNIGALATGDVGTLDIAALSATTVSNNVTGSWTEGANFARFNVTLTADNPVLTLFTISDIPSEGRGFLNSVQVTPVPEPAIYAALFGLLSLGFVAWRRRR